MLKESLCTNNTRALPAFPLPFRWCNVCRLLIHLKTVIRSMEDNIPSRLKYTTWNTQSPTRYDMYDNDFGACKVMA